MNKDMMKEALAKRRGKGLDLTIVLGGQQPDHAPDEVGSEKKDTGLAPEVKDKMIAHEEKELELMKKGELPPELEKQEMAEMQEYGPLFENMGDYEKEHIAKTEPKGIGARARKFAMEKMGK